MGSRGPRQDPKRIMSIFYKCYGCGETFEKPADSDAQAEVEKLAMWGDVPREECIEICEGCFNAQFVGTTRH